MRSFNLAFIGLLTAGLFLQSCSESTTGPNTPGGGLGTAGGTGEYRIIYSTGNGPRSEIALMNADGSGVRTLTNNTFIDIYPVVSPDGKTVLFQTFRNGDYGIYLMNIDGTNERMLVAEGATAVWSPNGSKIVYTSGESNNPDIWVINADGTGKRQLTSAPGRDFHPAWSPDGQLIAFASDREQTDEDRLYVMNADGSNQRRISTAQYSNSYVSRATPWSPDGRKLVFSGEPSSSSSRVQIFVVNIDGTSHQQLTNFGADGAAAGTWSPDGKTIAFAGDEGSEANIFVINPDGTGQRRVTNSGSATIHYPIWSPDGRTLVYAQGEALMSINVDGTGVRRLSAAGVEGDVDPLWTPVKVP